MAQDVVDDVGDRAGRVDADPPGRQVLTCLVDPEHERPFLGHVPELVGWAAIQAPLKGLNVHLEHEDFVEQVKEHRRVPRPAAEERHRTTLIGNECPYLVDVPDVVLMALLVRPTADRFVEKEASHAVTSTGQDPVAMHGLIAAPFKFLGHCGLTSTGDAINEVVASTHVSDGRTSPLRPPAKQGSLDHALQKQSRRTVGLRDPAGYCA